MRSVGENGGQVFIDHEGLLYQAMQAAIANLGTNLVPGVPDKKEVMHTLIKLYPSSDNKELIVEHFVNQSSKPRSPNNQRGVNRSFNAFLYYLRDNGGHSDLIKKYLAQVIGSSLNHGDHLDNDSLITRNNEKLIHQKIIEKAMSEALQKYRWIDTPEARHKKIQLETYQRLFTLSLDIKQQKNYLRLFYYCVAQSVSGYGQNQSFDAFLNELNAREGLQTLVRECIQDITVLRANRRPWIELKPEEIIQQETPGHEFEITEILQKIKRMTEENHASPETRRRLLKAYQKSCDLACCEAHDPEKKINLLRNQLELCHKILSIHRYGSFFSEKDGRIQLSSESQVQYSDAPQLK